MGLLEFRVMTYKEHLYRFCFDFYKFFTTNKLRNT